MSTKKHTVTAHLGDTLEILTKQKESRVHDPDVPFVLFALCSTWAEPAAGTPGELQPGADRRAGQSGEQSQHAAGERHPISCRVGRLPSNQLPSR